MNRKSKDGKEGNHLKEEEREKERKNGNEKKGWMKGLRKMFSISVVMWRGWRMTGLLRGSM